MRCTVRDGLIALHYDTLIAFVMYTHNATHAMSKNTLRSACIVYMYMYVYICVCVCMWSQWEVFCTCICMLARSILFVHVARYRSSHFFFEQEGHIHSMTEWVMPVLHIETVPHEYHALLHSMHSLPHVYTPLAKMIHSGLTCHFTTNHRLAWAASVGMGAA